MAEFGQIVVLVAALSLTAACGAPTAPYLRARAYDIPAKTPSVEEREPGRAVMILLDGETRDGKTAEIWLRTKTGFTRERMKVRLPYNGYGRYRLLRAGQVVFESNTLQGQLELTHEQRDYLQLRLTLKASSPSIDVEGANERGFHRLFENVPFESIEEISTPEAHAAFDELDRPVYATRGPRYLSYRPGPPPPGYEAHCHVEWARIGVGALSFTASYGLSLYAAINFDFNYYAGPLAVPIVGPWIWLARLEASRDDDEDHGPGPDLSRPAAAVLSGAQVFGLVYLFYASMDTEWRFRRVDPVTVSATDDGRGYALHWSGTL